MVASIGYYDKYANPRFCVDHVLRDEGISALSGWTSAAGFPLDRVLDNQQSLQARLSSAATVTLELQRAIQPAISHRVPISRIVIFNHNIGSNLSAVEVLVSDDDITYTLVRENDHRVASQDIGDMQYHAAPDVIDWHVNPTGFGIVETPAGVIAADGDYSRFWHLVITPGRAGFSAPEIGEIWFTRTLTTESGVAHKWDNGVLPNASNSRTSAGLVTTLDKNPADQDRDPARFTISYDRLPEGQDLRKLRYVHLKAGIRKNTLLYEHADQGNAPAILTPLESHVFGTSGILPLGNTTVSTRAGFGPTGQDVVRAASDAAGDYGWQFIINAGTDAPPDKTRTLDLRDSVLELSVHVAGAANVPVLIANGIWIDLLSGRDGDRTAGATAYQLAPLLDVDDLDNVWYRIALDPSTWPDTEQYTPVGNHDTNPVDLAAVNAIGLRMNADIAFRTVDASRLAIRPKARLPVPCLLTAYTERQVGSAPSGASGSLYDVSMAFEEITT